MIAQAVTAVALAAARPEPVGGRLLVARGGSIVQLDPADASTRVLLQGDDAAWSPDGTLIAYSRFGDLRLANSDGSGRRPLTATSNVEESDPAWLDAQTLVYTALYSDRRVIRVLKLPFGVNHRIAGSPGGQEWDPAVSSDGRRIAFASNRDGLAQIYVARPDGTAARPFHPPDPADANPAVDIENLAWAPRSGRLAYTADLADGSTELVTDDGTTRTVLSKNVPPHDSHPVWSPDGLRLAFAQQSGSGARQVLVTRADGSGAVARGAGAPLDWRVVPLGRPLFPDLVQRPPSGLQVSGSHGRWVLGFTSLVDNRGPGILFIHAIRPKGSPLMTVTQRIQLTGGGERHVQGTGFLRYTVAPPHYHWHLLGYDRYELRRASDYRLVVRDHKSGFCLADHYGIAPGIRHGPPRFLSSCGQFEPWLRSVDEGTSVGYTDRYPANFHGQNLNLTGVAAGKYWLVHRVNSELGLRETRYDNDAASLLVRITWPGGTRAAPRVQELRRCFAERC